MFDMDKIHVIILVVFILLSGCEKGPDCFKQPGKVVRDEREINDIHRLNVEDNINLILVRDSLDVLVVETGENLVKNVISERKGDTLHIYNDNTCNWLKGYGYQINVTVHFSNIDWLLYKGSGDIKTIDTLVLDKFWIGMMKSSGTVDMTININSLAFANSTGTADFKIRGKCSKLRARNDAYGFIDLSRLNAENVLFHQNGTHLAKIKAIHKLEGAVEYTGDLMYFGSPSVINVSVEGSGHLINGELY